MAEPKSDQQMKNAAQIARDAMLASGVPAHAIDEEAVQFVAAYIDLPADDRELVYEMDEAGAGESAPIMPQKKNGKPPACRK